MLWYKPAFMAGLYFQIFKRYKATGTVYGHPGLALLGQSRTTLRAEESWTNHAQSSELKSLQLSKLYSDSGIKVAYGLAFIVLAICT